MRSTPCRISGFASSPDRGISPPVADPPVTIAEELSAELLLAMLRRGLIDAGDIEAMSLSPQARDVANSLIAEASAPSQSEWRAAMARKRFVIVRSEEEAG